MTAFRDCHIRWPSPSQGAFRNAEYHGVKPVRNPLEKSQPQPSSHTDQAAYLFLLPSSIVQGLDSPIVILKLETPADKPRVKQAFQKKIAVIAGIACEPVVGGKVLEESHLGFEVGWGFWLMNESVNQKKVVIKSCRYIPWDNGLWMDACVGWGLLGKENRPCISRNLTAIHLGCMDLDGSDSQGLAVASSNQTPLPATPIKMGRPRLYHSTEEQAAANKRKSKKHYDQCV